MRYFDETDEIEKKKKFSKKNKIRYKLFIKLLVSTLPICCHQDTYLIQLFFAKQYNHIVKIEFDKAMKFKCLIISVLKIKVSQYYAT